MQDMPPVPPAVVEFAEEHNITNVKPNLYWNENEPYNGYIIYNGIDRDNKEMFYIILYKPGEVRYPNHKETEEIIKKRIYL